MSKLPTPAFTKSVVQDDRTDGYWIETFWVDPRDKVPGLIGYACYPHAFSTVLIWELFFSRYGLASGDICVFDNPINGGPKAPDGIGSTKPYCLGLPKANCHC